MEKPGKKENASSEPVAGLPCYYMNLDIDPAEKKLKGEMTIKWKNQSPEEVREFYFVFNRVNEKEDIIKDFKINDQIAFVREWRDYDFLTAGVRVKAPKPIAPGEECRFNVEFLCSRGENEYGYMDFIDNWFPVMIRTHKGKPKPWIQIPADYQVSVNLPENYNCVCTGNVIKEILKNGKRRVLTGASAVPGFGIFLSKDFIIERGEQNQVVISSVFFESGRKWGMYLLETAKDIISFYSELLGFYPGKNINILPGHPTKPWGGFAISPNCVVIHGGLEKKEADFGRWILAHEIAHQYWGYNYTLDDLSYPRWFGLSMGIYTDWQYSRARNISNDYYTDYENRYMGGVLAGLDTAIHQKVNEISSLGFDYKNVISHGKAFTVLRMLIDLVGEEYFKAIVEECLVKFRGRAPTLDEFRDLCEDVSDVQLDWFFHQWFKTDAHLDYVLKDFKSCQAGEEFITKCTVKKAGKAFMPVTVGMECRDGSWIYREVECWTYEKDVEFRSKSGPRRVVIDPKNKLPMLARAKNSFDVNFSAVAQLFIMGRYNQLIELAKNVGIDFSKQNRAQNFLLSLGAAYVKVGDLPSALDAYRQATKIGDKLDDSLTYLSMLSLGNVYDLMGNRKKALKYYENALEKDLTREAAKAFIRNPYQSLKIKQDDKSSK